MNKLMEERFFAIIIVALLAIVAAYFIPIPSLSQPHNINDPQLHARVAKETFRLESLSLERNLTTDDLKPLENLTRQDERFADEFEELKWMMDHNYPHHVFHSLTSLNAIALNQTVLCPADALSHVAVYLQWNETARAQGSLEDAQSNIDEWEMKVVKVREGSPSAYPGEDKLIEAMKQEIAQVQAGNYSAAITYGNYVDENGFC